MKTNMNTIDSEISCILKEVLKYEQPITLEQDLYQYGLDSIKIIALIVQLEEHFNITFDDNELLFENFSNKIDIIARIKEKVGINYCLLE
ncbi:acyl carrier protein [Paenibacillus gorillae]|uniref:acyl carrier protein n=1 Tax=Paenibacillus gorillae TaxID=1243662 RepID=UPI0006933ECF|nr:acyl carrier protein [Paenibacillus gorillae]